MGSYTKKQQTELSLKRVSEICALVGDPESPGELEKFHPGYYMHWCQYMSESPDTTPIDSITIVHGPQGCIGNQKAMLTTYMSQYIGYPFAHVLCTNMNSMDTVLGASEKLMEAILEADALYKPRAITVVITCCAGIIQEPAEDVVEQVKGQIGAERLFVLRLEGYRSYVGGPCRVHRVTRLAEELLPKKPPAKKIPNSVNILGTYKETHFPSNFLEDSEEYERLFHKIGITVNSVLSQSASLDAWNRAPEAELNVVVCPQRGFPIAMEMEKRFNIPYVRRLAPVGVTSTADFLRDVGNHFGLGKEAEEVIAEEYALIKDVWEEAKGVVQGKIAIIDGADPHGAVGRFFSLGQGCEDLGMRPIFINLPAVEIKSNNHHVDVALEMGHDWEVLWGFDYAFARRINPARVIAELGFTNEDVGLYIGDVFPRTMVDDWDKPIFDPCNVPRLVTTTHCTKLYGTPGRRIGFRAAGRFAQDVIDVNRMARRGFKPSLSGRIGGL